MICWILLGLYCHRRYCPHSLRFLLPWRVIEYVADIKAQGSRHLKPSSTLIAIRLLIQAVVSRSLQSCTRLVWQ